VDILDSQRVPINSDEREKRIAGKSAKELHPYFGATGQVGWIDDYLFDEELVLLGEDGAPFLEPNKKKAYIVKDKSWVNNHAHVLRAIADLVLSPIVCHYLNLFDFHGYVTGTTRLKLPQGPLKKIPFPLPPILEQERIVAKIEELLTRLDAGVKALQAVKAQLKRYRQSVLKSAFEGKLTAEWREAHKGKLEPASVLLERIKEERKTKLGSKYMEAPTVDASELPKGWEWVRLGALLNDVSYGTAKKCDYKVKGQPVLRIPNVANGYINQTDLKFAQFTDDEIKHYALKENDLLIIRSNGSVSLVGKSALVTAKDEGFLFAGYLIRLRLTRNGFNSKYLNLVLSTPLLREQIETKAKSTSGVNNINSEELRSLAIPLCSENEQNEIALEIERCFSVADAIEKAIDESLAQSERLRQSILKRAFEGKLVPQDPGDEPAEKLLERIKSEKERKEAVSRSGNARRMQPLRKRRGQKDSRVSKKRAHSL